MVGFPDKIVDRLTHLIIRRGLVYFLGGETMNRCAGRKIVCYVLVLTAYCASSASLFAFNPIINFDYSCADCAPIAPGLQASFQAAVIRGIENLSVPIHNDFDVDINVYVEPHSNQFLGSSSVTPVNVPYTVYRDLFVLSKAGTPLAEFASRLPSDSTGLFKTPVGTIASSMVELSPVLHKALGFFQLNSANPSIDLVLNRDMINQVGTSPDRYSLSLSLIHI